MLGGYISLGRDPYAYAYAQPCAREGRRTPRRSAFRRLAQLAVLVVALLAFGAAPASAANVTVSGVAIETLVDGLGLPATDWSGCNGVTNNVKLVLDAGAYTQTRPCDGTTGAFTFTTVPLTVTPHLITIYLVGSGTEQGVLYTRNTDLTSNITGLAVTEDFIRIRGNTPITNANIDIWDSNNDAAIPAISNGTALTTTASQPIGVYVEPGHTFTPGGNVTVDKAIIGGTWNSGAEVTELIGTGDQDCDDFDTFVVMDVICRRGTGTFNAGTGTLRFTLASGTAGTDVVGPFTFNVVQVYPANNLRQIWLVDSGVVTASSVEIGDGSTVTAWVEGTLNVTSGAGTILVNDAATLNGGGAVEARGNFTSVLTGKVIGGLDVTMRPNGGLVSVGSTSGAANWAVNDLIARTVGAAATVRTAAGGTGTIAINDDMTVGLASDPAITTMDLNTTDRQVDVQWLQVFDKGQLEMSDVRTLTVGNDAEFHKTLNTNGGTLAIARDADFYSPGINSMLASAVTVGQDFWIESGANYTVTGAGALDIGRTFNKQGTFNAGTGTVTFTDATRPSFLYMDTPTTFNNLRNLTPNKVLRVDKDWPTTVNGTLSLVGTSCTARASLASSVDGTPFSIAAAVVSANFADIGDSNQTSGARTASNSWNHGGNTNWTFTTPCVAHTISGFALQSEGGAGWSQCNGATPNVSLSINGFSPTSVPCTAGTGAFTFTTSLEPDAVMAVFLDPASTGDKGATYTRGPSPVVNMTGLTVVLGQARMRSETATGLTNADLLKYDSTFDTDVPISINDTNRIGSAASTVEVVVEAGKTYAPGAEMTVTAVDIAGTLGSTGNTSDSFIVTGLGTNASCTAALGTSVPACIRPGGTIAMAATDVFEYTGNGSLNVAAANYANLELNASSGTRTYQLGTSLTDNTINVSGWLNIDGNNIASTTSFNPNVNIVDDIDLDGVLSGSGTGTISLSDDIDRDGDVDLTGGTFRWLGAASSSSPAFCENGLSDYAVWDLEIANGYTSNRTVTSVGSCPFHVRSDLRVGRVADTNTSRLDINAGDSTFDVDGDVLITTRGDLSASNSSTLTIGGDFTNNGAFTHNSGTVLFDTTGTTSSINHTTATTFGNLSVLSQPKQLNFPAGRTTTIAGTMTITGTSCVAPVHIRSTVPGSQYTLNIGTVATTWATIMDSVAAPAKTAALAGDLGNNTGWTFSGGCTPGADTMFVHDSNASTGNANEPDIGSDTFHMSWNNASGMPFDQQQARVVTTPLTNVLGLWQFDTATGQAADTSGLGRTLTLAGTPTSPAGQTGFSEALGLNGTTQSATVTDAAFQLASNFTAEMWVKAPDTTGTKMLLERTSGANINYALDFNGGLLRAQATRNAGATFAVTTSAAPFADSLWHHVAMTVDSGNTLRLYLDGASVGTPQAIGGVVWSGAAAVTIGRNALGAQFFPGQIDDVRISSVARTAGEINGFAKLRDAHNKVIWTSAVLPTTCLAAARCADVVYSGPALRRPDARYYAQARGRLQPWVAFSAWSPADWFETSALLTISIPTGNIAFGSTMPGTNALSVANVDVTSTLTAGYKLYVSDGSDTAGMTGAGTLPDWTAAWDDPQPWPQANYGYFGATLLTGTNKDTTEWGTGTLPNDWTNVKYVGVRNTTPSLLVDRPGPTGATDTFQVGVRAAPALGQAAGTYSTTLTFTAIANP